MSSIKDEDLIKLYSELDKLTKQKKDLQDGYIALKLKSIETRKKNITYKKVIIGLFLLCLGILLFWFFNYNKTSKIKQETAVRELFLKDSIRSVSLGVQNTNLSINSKQLIYFVQIGNYKKIDLFNRSKAVSNFQQVKEKNYNTYLMGGFFKYAAARDFKNHIQNLGIKDAFLVAYKDSQKIDIREALKISNETEYLE